MDQLKTCPFCAGTAIVITIFPNCRWAVKCAHCNSQTWDFPGTDDGWARAISSWNRRDGDRCHDGCVVDKALTEFYASAESFPEPASESDLA